MDAAAALFAASGYRGTTVAAVARAVGITDAGVLHHFKTKEALLLGVLQQYARSVEARIDEAGLHGIDLLRALRRWGAGMEARSDIASLLIRLTTEHLTGEAPARRAIQAAYAHLLARYEAAFAAAAAHGDLRADLDPAFEASALVAHLDGIRLQWFLTDGRTSMADSVRAYMDATLDPSGPGTVRNVTDTRPADTGMLFHDAAAVGRHGRLARAGGASCGAPSRVLRVDDPGFAPFWVLTRHADVFAVSRDNARWHNTPRSVLGPDADWQEMVDSGMPLPASLVHLDGTVHRGHRAVTNDWFKPAAVRHRQPRIDELADLFVDRIRELGGECDFAARHRPALHAAGDHGHLRRARERRAADDGPHPGHLRGRRPRVPRRGRRPRRAGDAVGHAVHPVLQRPHRGPPCLPGRRPRHGHRQRRGRRLPDGRRRAALVLHHRRHRRARHHVVRPGRRDGAARPRPRAAVRPGGRRRRGRERGRRDHPVDVAGAPLPALRHRAGHGGRASTSPRAAGCCSATRRPTATRTCSPTR